MHLYFDESGDYSFPPGLYDCYAQAALIAPDRILEEVESFTTECCGRWKVSELHATELDSDQLLEVAAFIGGSDCQLLAHVTDTHLITLERIEEFRLDQAARLKENLDWYRRESTRVRGEPVAEIEEWMLRQIKRSGLASQIPHGEFLQSFFLVELITKALQKSLYWFQEARWREDFQEFRFHVDAKLVDKLASGEKFLDETLVPSLGSRPNESIGVPEAWKKEPDHPFVRRYNVERGRVAGREVRGAIDLKALFEHGIEFEDSRDSAGIQLVDAVAYTARRAVLEPRNEQIQETYDALRPKLRNEDGKCLTIARLNAGEEDLSTLDRFRPLFDLERTE